MVVRVDKRWHTVVRRAINGSARIGVLDPMVASALKTQLEFSELPNLWRPQTLNEKLLSKCLSDRREILVQTADKAAVRSYVADRVGEDVLSELIYVGCDLERFDLEPIRRPMAVKATHASGADWLRLVPDPSEADWTEIREAARRWATTPYEPGSHQWWYHRIPRQVMVEEFLGDPELGPPTDYKFYVVNQQVRVILSVSGRFSSLRRSLHTPDWISLHHEYRYPDADDNAPRPPHLLEMIDIAENLAVDFVFVRVDLYDTDAGVRFGELTHCPRGGALEFSDSPLGRRLAADW